MCKASLPSLPPSQFPDFNRPQNYIRKLYFGRRAGSEGIIRIRVKSAERMYLLRVTSLPRIENRVQFSGKGPDRGEGRARVLGGARGGHPRSEAGGAQRVPCAAPARQAGARRAAIPARSGRPCPALAHCCFRGESTHAAAAGVAGPLNKEGEGGWARGARSEPRNCRQVFFLSTELGKGPAPCPARPALLGSSRVSGEPAEQGRRTVGPLSPFLRLLTRSGAGDGGRTAEVRFAPATPPPPPQGNVHRAVRLAYKVLGGLASFEEEENWSRRGRPAGRSSPGTGRSPAPRTRRASRGGQARMEREALHRTGDSGAVAGRVRRPLVYPRPRGGQQQVLPRLFPHPSGTCGFPARTARRGRRLASRSPSHIPRHPKSSRGPRRAPSCGRGARGAP